MATEYKHGPKAKKYTSRERQLLTPVFIGAKVAVKRRLLFIPMLCRRKIITSTRPSKERFAGVSQCGANL
jgi:hypothetical protein